MSNQGGWQCTEPSLCLLITYIDTQEQLSFGSSLTRHSMLQSTILIAVEMSTLLTSMS